MKLMIPGVIETRLNISIADAGDGRCSKPGVGDLMLRFAP